MILFRLLSLCLLPFRLTKPRLEQILNIPKSEVRIIGWVIILGLPNSLAERRRLDEAKSEVGNPELDNVVGTNFDLFLTSLNGKVSYRNYFPPSPFAATNSKPSCCINPKTSETAYCCTTLPPLTRWMTNGSNISCLPLSAIFLSPPHLFLSKTTILPHFPITKPDSEDLSRVRCCYHVGW